MLDELRSRDWVPRSVRRNAREVAQAIGQLKQELGRNATETEVAERLGIDIADYRQMLLDTNNSQIFSYDEWREEHGDSIELVTGDHQRENLYNNCWTVICASRGWKPSKRCRSAKNWY